MKERGKEISIEEAKRLPEGTLVWVTNDYLTPYCPKGELREITTYDGILGLRGSEVTQSNGCTGSNGHFNAPNLKIYEWKEVDVKMVKGRELTKEEVKALPSGTKVWVEKTPDIYTGYDKVSKVYTIEGNRFACENHVGCYMYTDGDAIRNNKIKVYEWKEEINMVEQLLNELKNGDLVYVEYKGVMADHTGWKIIINEGLSGLNTQAKNSHTGSLSSCLDGAYKEKRTIKYIKLEEITNRYNFAGFLRTFDESRIKSIIHTITYKTKEEEEIESIISDLQTQLESAKTRLKNIKGDD